MVTSLWTHFFGPPCTFGVTVRSGVALAMRRRLQWFIHLRAHSLRKGDEHPAYIPHGVWQLTLPLPLGLGWISRTGGGKCPAFIGASVDSWVRALTRRRLAADDKLVSRVAVIECVDSARHQATAPARRAADTAALSR